MNIVEFFKNRRNSEEDTRVYLPTVIIESEDEKNSRIYALNDINFFKVHSRKNGTVVEPYIFNADNTRMKNILTNEVYSVPKAYRDCDAEYIAEKVLVPNGYTSVYDQIDKEEYSEYSPTLATLVDKYGHINFVFCDVTISGLGVRNIAKEMTDTIFDRRGKLSEERRDFEQKFDQKGIGTTITLEEVSENSREF